MILDIVETTEEVVWAPVTVPVVEAEVAVLLLQAVVITNVVADVTVMAELAVETQAAGVPSAPVTVTVSPVNKPCAAVVVNTPGFALVILDSVAVTEEVVVRVLEAHTPPSAISPALSLKLKSAETAPLRRLILARLLAAPALPRAQLPLGKVRPPSVDQQMPLVPAVAVALLNTAATQLSLGYLGETMSW